MAVPPLVNALVQAARLQGAPFESPVEIVRVEPRGNSVLVHADGRTLEADAVVVAAGTWSGRVRIDNLPKTPVRPMRGQLLHLKWAAGRSRSVPCGAREATRCRGSRTRCSSARRSRTSGSTSAARSRACRNCSTACRRCCRPRVRPSLSEIRVGLRPATSDLLPIIGPLRSAPRVVIATGHYRNGILLAPLTAEIVAHQILDGVSDPAILVTSPQRFLDKEL